MVRSWPTCDPAMLATLGRPDDRAIELPPGLSSWADTRSAGFGIEASRQRLGLSYRAGQRLENWLIENLTES